MASATFIVVVSVFISTFALINGQKPCCSPEKWSAHLLQKTGAYNSVTTGASKRDVSSFIYYDHTVKKMAIFSDIKNTTFNSTTFLQRIVDYNKGLEWRIDGKNCTRHVTTEPMPQPCFLDGADFFGYHKMAEMAVEVWFKDDGKGHTSRTTMSRDPCVLVTETTRSMGPGLDYVLSFGIYENVTTGYVEPGNFEVPSFCPRAGEVILEHPKQRPMWPWHVPAAYISP